MSQVENGTVTAGSLFVTADGTAYRLRDYRRNWRFEGDEGDPGAWIASYVAMLPTGAATTRDTLPADARLVWAPDLDGT